VKISLLFKDQYYQTLLKEGVFDKNILKVIFLAGGPGSGKSFVSGKVTAGQGMKFINSDTYFEHLLKKAKLSMDLPSLSPDDRARANDLFLSAKDKMEKTQKNYLDGRLGVIFDGTGSNYELIASLRQQCEDLGYDTYMLFVNTSLDVALDRNNKRERTVDPDIVTNSWNAVQRNIGKFQNLFGSQNFIVVDNDKFNENVLNKVWKQINNILSKPVKNPIGKKWIDSQLKLRNRLEK
jgi:predicted kinase